MARAGARTRCADGAGGDGDGQEVGHELGVNDPEIRKDRLLLGRGPDVASDLDTAQGQVP